MTSESTNTQQYDVQNGDVTGTAFTVPGDNPDEEPFDLDENFDQYYRWYVHIDNGFNENVDVTVQGSHALDTASNNTLDTPADDGAAVTVSSETTDFIDGTTNHAKLQLNVDPAADPTSGTLTVTIEKRKS